MIRIDESPELDPERDYPFRRSLTRVARCGMCRNFVDGYCTIGLQTRGPYMITEHDCPEYEYEPDMINEVPSDKVLMFGGLEDRREECNDCGYLFMGRCDGIRYYPFDLKDGKCEFFHDKRETCKHAIPMLQYGGRVDHGYYHHTRNNYCKLPPEERDEKNRGDWRLRCLFAHQKGCEKFKKCHAARTVEFCGMDVVV